MGTWQGDYHASCSLVILREGVKETLLFCTSPNCGWGGPKPNAFPNRVVVIIIVWMWGHPVGWSGTFSRHFDHISDVREGVKLTPVSTKSTRLRTTKCASLRMMWVFRKTSKNNNAQLYLCYGGMKFWCWMKIWRDVDFIAFALFKELWPDWKSPNTVSNPTLGQSGCQAGI